MFGKHSLDLEKQFTFYASYHNNPINVLIHILCIWPILATGLVILQVRNCVSNLTVCTLNLNSGLSYLQTTVQQETFMFLHCIRRQLKTNYQTPKPSDLLTY